MWITMPSHQAPVAVSREKHASAALAAHQPFPVGLDSRPLLLEQSEALLTSPCDWTTSVPSFLFREIAQRDGGACFTELKQSAERDFLSDHPDERAFPVFRLADFLEVAYRSGLLAKNFVAPNGDIYSPHRILMYEIASDARALLAHHAPVDIERKADVVPALTEIETRHAREQLAPVLDYLTEHGSSVRDTMLDTLTCEASNDTVQAEWDRLEDAIEQGIQLGIISQEENRLGAQVLRIAPSGLSHDR
jgi:hypothetical protein